jgi:hypothetical protein
VATILYGVERDAGGRDALMPGFGQQSYVHALSDQEIVDISAYVHSRFGNNDARVTLEDVAVARAGGPVPLIAKAQPYILPAMALGFLVIFILGFAFIRRVRNSPS